MKGRIPALLAVAATLGVLGLFFRTLRGFRALRLVVYLLRDIRYIAGMAALMIRLAAILLRER
ncbi:MAG TPA: hypothetical protein EYP17_12035 [Candidatus Latescibacteria bacterium]|nr:hypothetical protein [Candidatus Latescibacterota bacterium]